MKNKIPLFILLKGIEVVKTAIVSISSTSTSSNTIEKYVVKIEEIKIKKQKYC